MAANPYPDTPRAGVQRSRFGVHRLGRWWFFGGSCVSDRGFGVDRLGRWWFFEGFWASGRGFEIDQLGGCW
jgi:hypothetical protein